MAEAVKVIVRCRPMNAREKNLNCKDVINIDTKVGQCALSHANDKKAPPKTFTFDGAYGTDSTTEQIYADIGYPLVEGVTEGYNGTIFAYGQTGCGKSFSMQGITDPTTQRGIIPRAFDHIFETIQVSETAKYLVHATYLEIYNEDVRDLLGKDVKVKLDLKEHPDKGVYVQNLSMHACKNVRDCQKVMERGWNNRSTGATLMNADSSRSHSIFSIHLERCEANDNGEEHIRAAKLNLVDLAGSERQAKTGSTGDRLKEATKINLSLSALGNVISALVDGKSKHIPYRDSKLTRLLQDSLGGNTKTLMVACLSPADNNYDETLSTLRYANRAKNIKNKPKINEDPKDAMLREFQEEINRLKMMLRGEIPVNFEGGTAAAPAKVKVETKVVEKIVTVPNEDIEKEKERVKQEYEEKMAAMQQDYDEMKLSKAALQEEMSNLREQYDTEMATVESSVKSPGQKEDSTSASGIPDKKSTRKSRSKVKKIDVSSNDTDKKNTTSVIADQAHNEDSDTQSDQVSIDEEISPEKAAHMAIMLAKEEELAEKMKQQLEKMEQFQLEQSSKGKRRPQAKSGTLESEPSKSEAQGVADEPLRVEDDKPPSPDHRRRPSLGTRDQTFVGRESSRIGSEAGSEASERKGPVVQQEDVDVDSGDADYLADAQHAVHLATVRQVVKEGLTAPRSSPTGDHPRDDISTEEAMQRLRELQQAMVGGEDANNEEKKERRRKKKKYAEDKKNKLLEALANKDGEEIMMDIFDNTQMDLEKQRKLLEKQKRKNAELQSEILDLQSEFELDRIDYLDTIRKQEQQMAWQQAIIDKIHPCLRRDCNYVNLDRIKMQSQWDEENQKWNLPKMTIEKSKLPGAPGVMPGGRQEPQYSRQTNGDHQPNIYDELRYEDRYLQKLQQSTEQNTTKDYFKSKRTEQLLRNSQDDRNRGPNNISPNGYTMNGYSSGGSAGSSHGLAPWQGDSGLGNRQPSAEDLPMRKPQRLESLMAPKSGRKKKKQYNMMENL